MITGIEILYIKIPKINKINDKMLIRINDSVKSEYPLNNQSLVAINSGDSGLNLFNMVARPDRGSGYITGVINIKKGKAVLNILGTSV
jgi:hypothetical protein